MRDVVKYVKYLLCVVESKLFKDLNYVPIYINGRNSDPICRHSAPSLLFGVLPNIYYTIYMRICAGCLLPTL